MSDPETPAEQESVSFPRGGRGPVVPAPRGSGVALAIVSLAVIAGVVALTAWLFF